MQEAMQEKERRFLILVQLFDEKYRKLSCIEKQTKQLTQVQGQSKLTALLLELKQFVESFGSMNILTDSMGSKYPPMLPISSLSYPKMM